MFVFTDTREKLQWIAITYHVLRGVVFFWLPIPPQSKNGLLTSSHAYNLFSIFVLFRRVRIRFWF